MHEQPQNLYYDREHSLHELLKEFDRVRLEQVLQGLLGEGARLLDVDGTVLLGPAHTSGGAQRLSFRLDFEPIGYLEGARVEALPAAVACVEMLLGAAMRYLMASAVHMEAVQADFTELQEKNTALQASEARYKALAESLEIRVHEQVETIERAQRQLYQAEKLASVGQLAAGVAHEINNPLGFVKSNLNSANAYLTSLQRLGELARGQQGEWQGERLVAAWEDEQMDALLEDFPVLLNESIEGIERVAKIVAALKDFSSIDRAGESCIDLNALLDSTCRMAASEFGSRVQLVTDYGALPKLSCHPGRLAQVFMNLLLNAVQAIPGDGAVRIETRSDGTDIEVRIGDTGRGMSEAVLARVFDPFFTTHDVGAGTGLGLTVARDVVRAHGGRIAVDSQPGVGTTFTITIPVSSHG
ncbi:MAG: two-component sensor histidine kinase [Gammaproteobacteria bacterium]|nr:two-component sensor histidine kinase [Gammaproteobacteria bacterium]